jgi:hypothetical protein
MLIVLLLAALAIGTGVGLVLALVGSAALGCAPWKARGRSYAATLFLVTIPSAVVGSAVGGVTLGAWAPRNNEHLVIVGPLAGLLIGAVVGGVAGSAVAAVWVRRKVNASAARTAAAGPPSGPTGQG